MFPSTDAAHLQQQIDAQRELARLATLDKIRAMHQDLEKLYRARLVAVLLAERLAAAGAPPPPGDLVVTPIEPLWRAPCTSTSSRPMVRAMISR